MKKNTLLTWVLILLLLFQTVGFAEPENDEPELTSPSYILINQDSGEVLLSHDADAKHYPASTTKIMTALLAIENLDMEAETEVSETAVMTIPWDSSKLGLYAGEVLKNYDITCAMLVASGNDAANVLAEEVSGDVDTFIEKMNARAAELGCTGTHFNNTHGYTDPEHYTTAADMAKIAQAAMQNETFRKMVKTVECELPVTEQCQTQRHFITTNNLLTEMRAPNFAYEGATGVKTGYTDAALNCLVASAERGGVRLLTVILGASYNADGINLAFADSIKLFDWGFSHYKNVIVAHAGEVVDEVRIKHAKGTKTVKLCVNKDCGVVMKSTADEELIERNITTNPDITAPVSAGDVLGTMTLSYNGEVVAEAELTADRKYDYSWWSMFVAAVLKILGILVLVILAVIVVLVIIRQVEYEKRRKKRLAERAKRQR